MSVMNDLSAYSSLTKLILDCILLKITKHDTSFATHFTSLLYFQVKQAIQTEKKTFTSEVSAGKDITSELTAFLYKSRKTEMDATIVSSTS